MSIYSGLKKHGGWIFFGMIAVFNMLSLGKLAELSLEQDENQDEKKTSQIEMMLQDMQASPGNTYGTIYTIDGIPMTEHVFKGKEAELDDDGNKTGVVFNVTDEESTRSKLSHHVYSTTDNWYASLVGLNHSSAHGLLQTVKSVLSTNSSYMNRVYAVGDSVVTTIVSDGQKEAYEQLEGLKGVCKWSNITVVNSDGAILVNVGSNCDDIVYYNNALIKYYDSKQDGVTPPPTPPDYLYTYAEFGSCNFQTEDINMYKYTEGVGSSFKTITARILQLNNNLLSEEKSVYNTEYIDNGIYTLTDKENKKTIHNVDYQQDSADGKTGYPKKSSLADAMINSSNYYFLDHVEALGWEKYQSELTERFFLNSKMRIDAYSIPAMPYSAEQINSDITFFPEQIAYGQEARIAPIRLASLYSYAISGNFVPPFMIAQVLQPVKPQSNAGKDYQVIYQCNPKADTRYHFDVNMKDDIVIDALRKTFASYKAKAVARQTELTQTLNAGKKERAEELFQTAVREHVHMTRQEAEKQAQLDIQEELEEKKAGLLTAYPAELLDSGRFLAKSGTSVKELVTEKKDGQTVVKKQIENHSMVLTLLDESQEHVICTAVLTANYADCTSEKNQKLMEADMLLARLMPVLEALEVF